MRGHVEDVSWAAALVPCSKSAPTLLFAYMSILLGQCWCLKVRITSLWFERMRLCCARVCDRRTASRYSLMLRVATAVLVNYNIAASEL